MVAMAVSFDCVRQVHTSFKHMCFDYERQFQGNGKKCLLHLHLVYENKLRGKPKKINRLFNDVKICHVILVMCKPFMKID